jgi:hypothetical protein
MPIENEILTGFIKHRKICASNEGMKIICGKRYFFKKRQEN